MSKINERVNSIKISGKDPSAGIDTEDSKTENRTAQKYWNRLKKITAIWMLAWSFPAILLHIPIGTTHSIKILGGIPLHWFNAALLSILIGIVLIFLYAFVMDKTDKIFKGD